MNRQRRSVVFLASVLALFLSSALRAHDFWIEPSTFTPQPRAFVAARLLVGVGYRGDLVPRDDSRIVRFALYGPTGQQPVPGRDGSDPAGLVLVPAAGIHVIGYESNEAVVDLDAAKIEQYIQEEGLEPFLELTPEQKAAGIRDHYVRCAKSILVAGDAGKKAVGFDHRFGFPLELVPEANPGVLRKGGKLPVRLLRDGKPLEDALVIAMERDAPERKIGGRTDRNGRVVLALPGPGVWIAKAVHIAPASTPGEWKSSWASLTFEIIP